MVLWLSCPNVCVQSWLPLEHPPRSWPRNQLLMKGGFLDWAWHSLHCKFPFWLLGLAVVDCHFLNHNMECTWTFLCFGPTFLGRVITFYSPVFLSTSVGLSNFQSNQINRRRKIGLESFLCELQMLVLVASNHIGLLPQFIWITKNFLSLQIDFQHLNNTNKRATQNLASSERQGHTWANCQF